MDILQRIAEERIREAIQRGEFENLPNSGRPLSLDDDHFVPDDLRVAYRVLKNAGYIPPELALRKEISSLRELIDTLDDDGERLRRIRELDFRILKLNMMRKRPFSLSAVPEYEDAIARRFVG